MLSPEYLLRVSEGGEEIAERLHQDILERIIERITLRLDRRDGYILTAQDKWQIEVLQDAGLLREDIAKEIAKATGLMQTEIAEAMEDAGVQAINYDNSIYKAAGLSPLPLEQSPYLIRLMQRTYEATVGEWVNFTRTTADGVQQAFIQACDKAYTQVASGSLGYSQAFLEAINAIIDSGATVTYPSGHTDTIETATLRCIRTGISQATAQITDARMDEMNWDTILVSAHLGARVNDKQDFTNHYWWQGKFYSKSGNDKRFPPYSVCGEGNVQGIHGANCRHSHGPGDGEFNPYDQYDSEENRREFELQQRQRTMERRIRESKHEVMGLKKAMDCATTPESKAAVETEYQKAAALLQKRNKAYNDFCEENNLKKLSERITVAKWDRSQAAEARAAAKKHHTDWLKSIGAESTSLNTIDKYLSAKYDGTDDYGILDGYRRAVEKGDISPLGGLQQYKITAAAIDDYIVGEITSTGVQIEGYVSHLIDRVIGQSAESHPGKRRGVPVSDALDALLNPVSPPVTKTMADGDIRQTFTGKNAKVTISKRDKIVIQTNPWR